VLATVYVGYLQRLQVLCCLVGENMPWPDHDHDHVLKPPDEKIFSLLRVSFGPVGGFADGLASSAGIPSQQGGGTDWTRSLRVIRRTLGVLIATPQL
jgi:hypothetical protein